MNKARVLQLAAAVLASDRFAMSIHHTCFIGHAEECATGEYKHFFEGGWGSREMFEWLEIDRSTLPHNGAGFWSPTSPTEYTSQLPREPELNSDEGLSTITREQAARMLEKFADTGEIDWHVAPKGWEYA